MGKKIFILLLNKEKKNKEFLVGHVLVSRTGD